MAKGASKGGLRSRSHFLLKLLLLTRKGQVWSFYFLVCVCKTRAVRVLREAHPMVRRGWQQVDVETGWVQILHECPGSGALGAKKQVHGLRSRRRCNVHRLRHDSPKVQTSQWRKLG